MPSFCGEWELNPLKSLSLRLVGYSITLWVTLGRSPHFGGEEAIHSEALGEKICCQDGFISDLRYKVSLGKANVSFKLFIPIQFFCFQLAVQSEQFQSFPGSNLANAWPWRISVTHAG